LHGNQPRSSREIRRAYGQTWENWDYDQVVAEFWAAMTKADEPDRSLIGCFIARLDPSDGRGAHFRQYWLVTQGHPKPFGAWGSA